METKELNKVLDWLKQKATFTELDEVARKAYFLKMEHQRKANKQQDELVNGIKLTN